ncbi:MAG: GHKL domain-containing protein [Acidobacteria bacterium]|nr:GHKL domain-containing protein [Acidobacteriota bacterium]
MALVLLIMLGLQMRSLRNLEQSTGAVRRLDIRNYLLAVAINIQDFYEKMARDALSVPSDFFVKREYEEIANHFRRAKPKGVKLFFLLDFDETGASQILFYDPNKGFTLHVPTALEMNAVKVATIPWVLFRERAVPANRNLVVDERDPENRIIFKPSLDNAFRVIGIVGMIIEPAFFREYLLPKLIQKNLQEFFPEESQKDFIISVHDGDGRQLFATQHGQGQGDEFLRPWRFVFTEWYLKVQSRYITPEQWASRNFLLSLSIAILMIVTLLGGFFFLMQNASRTVKLSQMKADFVSNISHELRTPLSSIKVLAEFMRLGRVKNPEAFQKYGQQIESEAQRLGNLIDKMLDFSKIESGQKGYEFQEADVGQLVSDALNALELEFEQGGFAVDYYVSPQPLPPVMMDKEAITEAFVNLLDNAMKYSGANKYIGVQLGRKNGFITVSVSDRGIGLQPEDQKKVFEKFYRVSTGYVHNVKGSGLGLSIVKNTVDAHHGKITVESGLGQGSTFTVHLPIIEG